MVRENHDGIRVRGAGTWMHVGKPVNAASELQLDEFAGIRTYAPGDLTISVGAATTLAALDAATREHGQWCPLEAWGDDASTIGAVLATATVGPFADTLGRPRDVVLGMECVDGRGRVIRAGGRVVKNVAGFDLTRLMTGAWGTLGVITEVHLRLRARPAVDGSFSIAGADPTAMHLFARSVHAPLAVVALNENVTQAIGHAGHGGFLVRLGGNSSAVKFAQRELASLGACSEVDANIWQIVRREMAPAPHIGNWKWTPLAKRVKAAFDPRDILNPGLLGDAV
jgi:glycolate oxidase FAD binding subunit